MLWKPEVGLNLQGHSSDNEIAPWIRPVHNPNNFSCCNENHSLQIVPNCYLCHFFFLAEWINEEKSFRWDILVLHPLKETKGNRGKVTQLLAGEKQVFLYSWWIDSFSGVSHLKHQFPCQPDGFEPNTTTYCKHTPLPWGQGSSELSSGVITLFKLLKLFIEQSIRGDWWSFIATPSK